MANYKTIREMAVGEKGNIYPSRVLNVTWLSRKWLDPADVVYDAPGLGAQVERTEDGFTVRVRYGCGYPSTSGLTDAELQEAGYVPVTDFQEVGYLWPNS